MLTSHPADFAEVSVEPPLERSDEFRPTRYMQRVAELLAERGELSQRVICDVVTGKATTIREALSYLIADGYVTKSTPHKLIKSYHSEDQA